MLIKIFFLENVEVWNTLLMLIYYIFIFYALGRILQKRLNFNNSNIMISIPLGFIIFLCGTFLIQFPFSIFEINGNSILNAVILLKELLIFAIIFIYFSDWKITFNTSGLSLSIHDYVLFGTIFIFILYVVLANIFIETFNQVSSDREILRNTNSVFTTLSLNEYNIQLLQSNNFISQTIYYEWFLYFLYAFLIYATSTLFTRNKTKSLNANTFLSFITSIAFVSLFFLFSTQQVILLEVIIMFLAISILFDYYNKWMKNNYNIILVFFTLFVLFTISYNGIFYFLIFFVGIILYQAKINKNYTNLFLYGFYIFFLEMIIYLTPNQFIVAIVFSFAILIFLFPLTINNMLKNSYSDHSYIYKEMVIKHELKESTIESYSRGGKLISIAIFFGIFILGLILINITDNSFQDFYSDYYSLSILPDLNQQKTFFAIFFILELPLIMIYIIDFFLIKEDDEYTIFTNIYLIFLNPISLGAINIFFNVNFEALFILWIVLLANYMIFKLPKKVYQLISLVDDKILIKYEKRHKRKNKTINTRTN